MAMGFTDDERAAEEARRKTAKRAAEAQQFENQRRRIQPDDLTCMICNLPFAAHQASDRNLPICANC